MLRFEGLVALLAQVREPLARCAAAMQGGDGRGQNDVRSQSQQQIADSLAHLDKKKQMGIEEVTAIRTEADFRENRRRIKACIAPPILY